MQVGGRGPTKRRELLGGIGATGLAVAGITTPSARSTDGSGSGGYVVRFDDGRTAAIEEVGNDVDLDACCFFERGNCDECDLCEQSCCICSTRDSGSAVFPGDGHRNRAVPPSGTAVRRPCADGN